MITIDKYIISKRKSIKIEINSLGELIVYAPRNCAQEEVKKFVLSKANWIEKHQSKIKSIIRKNEEILNYEKILILGEIKNVVEYNQKKVVLEDDNLFVPKYVDIRKKVNAIEKFLKAYISEILERRVDYLSNLMQLEPASVSLSNAKKRWGSCDSQANILFNWRLVMCPPKIIDYVIIHELSHIIEMNHSQEFWNIVAMVMPDYEQSRKLLKESDFILTTFRTI